MNLALAAALALVGYLIGSISFARIVGKRVVPDADLTSTPLELPGGATIEFEPDETHLPVAVEPDAFGVVLNNLLDNAVKYSFDAPRRVRVRTERRGARALLHVDDWGIGVPETERDRRLAHTVDDLRARFGRDAVLPGRIVRTPAPSAPNP